MSMLENLSSGGFAALFGALIGGCLSWLMQKRDQAQHQRGAGRALLAEMQDNSICLKKLALSEPLDFRYSNSAWLQQLPLVAHLMPFKELMTLYVPYRWAPTVLQEKQRDMASLLQLSKLFCEAARRLSPHVLSRKERQLFDGETSEYMSALEERVASLNQSSAK